MNDRLDYSAESGLLKLLAVILMPASMNHRGRVISQVLWEYPTIFRVKLMLRNNTKQLKNGRGNK